MAVHWRARALQDIQSIVQHIAEQNPVAARDVAAELLLAGDSLEMFPHRGRIGRRPGLRELVAIWPYIIVYRIDRDDNVTILRVWHGARDRG